MPVEHDQFHTPGPEKPYGMPTITHTAYLLIQVS